MVVLELEQDMTEEGDTDTISTVNKCSSSTCSSLVVLTAMQRSAPSGPNSGIELAESTSSVLLGS